MSDEPLKDTLADYVLGDAKEGTPNGYRSIAAHGTVRSWIENDPELAWRFVEVAYQSDLSDKELTFVAAGALEDLLSVHGERFFERLETAVRREARARFMVAGVWQGGMSNTLWNRIVEMRERYGIKPV